MSSSRRSRPASRASGSSESNEAPSLISKLQKRARRRRKPPKTFSSGASFSAADDAASKGEVPRGADGLPVVIMPGKCCSQCGATKTPQWREGPLGPKTLCNACGVKRVRQARAAADGKLRIAKAAKKRAAGSEGPMQTAGSGNYSGRQSARHRLKAQGKRASAAARATAIILAAVEQRERESGAANDEGLNSRRASPSLSLDIAQVKAQSLDDRQKLARLINSHARASSTSGAQGDSNSHSEGEELQFIPPKPPMTPISTVIGEGGVAALGLMSMSLPDDMVTQSMQSQMEAYRQTLADSLANPMSPNGKAQIQANYPLHFQGYFQGTAEHQMQLKYYRDELNDLHKATASADATLATVAQVLALKQAVALRCSEAIAVAQAHSAPFYSG